MARIIKGKIWENASIASGVNWFATAIAGPPGQPCEHEVTIKLPESSVVNLIKIFGGIPEPGTINRGVALVANAWYDFTVKLYPGQSYNFQHSTGLLEIKCTIWQGDIDG